MRTILLGASLAAFMAVTTHAQPDRERRPSDDPFQFLASKYDADKDGVITLAEYQRGEEKFKRLDRNGDGKLTKDDFAGRRGRAGGGKRSRRGPSRRQVEAIIRRVFTRYVDADSNGTVTRDEFDRFLGKVAPKGEAVTNEGLSATGIPERMTALVNRAFDGDRDGKTTKAEFEGVFRKLDRNEDGKLTDNEITTAGGFRRPGSGGGRRRGGGGGDHSGGGRQQARTPAPKLPKTGDVAPDFELPVLGKEKKSVKLSSLAGKRPVALIFGSYT